MLVLYFVPEKIDEVQVHGTFVLEMKIHLKYNLGYRMTRATCGMDGIGMTAFYDSGNFNLQHVLFLLEDAATVSSFRLECNVKVCDKTDPNSDCNKAVLPCMDEVQKNEYLCDGFCNEECEVSNDVPVCVPTCRTLHQAAVAGDNDCADSFIDGGNVDTLFEGTSPVYQAVGRGHIDIVRTLIDNGADLNQPAGDDCEILGSCTRAGDTPLHEAVIRDEHEIVELLLANGANVAAKNIRYTDRQPIHDAVVYDNYFLIDVLVAHGADINIADSDGNTALILASRTAVSLDEDESDEGNNVTARRKRRRVDTRRRQSQGRPQMVEKCIEKGAQVNHLNKWGRSAVHASAFYGETEILGILVNGGGDINAVDANGYTPMIDASRGQLETSSREVFKDAGEVAARRKRRRISCQGHPQTVLSCLSHGAQVNALNKWGQSALSFGMNTQRPGCGSRVRSTLSVNETSVYSAFKIVFLVTTILKFWFFRPKINFSKNNPKSAPKFSTHCMTS